MSTPAIARPRYMQRSADLRFFTLDTLITDARHEKNLSRERQYKLGDLTVRPVTDDGAGYQDLEVTSKAGSARFTHWSFGQFARLVGAPAAYLRDRLSAKLAADCLNEGLQAEPETEAKILVRAPNGEPAPTIRAVTTPMYARYWDADLYAGIADRLGGSWELPNPGGVRQPETHRSDRSSSVLLVSREGEITDPSAPGERGMRRALRIGNSEVGGSSVWIEEMYFRLVCSNGMYWSRIIGEGYRRRHVGDVAERTIDEIARIAANWQRRSGERDQAIVTGLIDRRIGETDEEAIAVLRSLGATEDQAESALRTTRATETVDPLSYWGIVQGLTRDSQAEAYQDDRIAIDRLAGLILQRGSKLVAA